MIKFVDLDCENPDNDVLCEVTYPANNYPSLRIYPHGMGNKRNSNRIFSN